MSSTLLQTFHSVPVKLCIVHCLTTNAFIRQEIQKLVPGHFAVILAIELAYHAYKRILIDLDSFLKLLYQLKDRYALVLVRPSYKHALWQRFKLWKQFFHLFDLFWCEVKRVQPLFRQMPQSFEAILNSHELLLGNAHAFLLRISRTFLRFPAATAPVACSTYVTL